MLNIIHGAGIFFYPLAIFSIMGVYILVERFFALREKNIMPHGFVEAFMSGRIPDSPLYKNTVGGRIIHFYKESKPEVDALKAYAQLEVTHMERGMFILDIIVTGAPLLGLLGTVTGLVQVFASVSFENGMPDSGVFVQGIALALTTTLLGLAVAIPALAGSRFLYRKIEKFAAQLGVGIERLIDISRQNEIRA